MVRFQLVARHRTSPRWLTIGEYQSAAQLREGLQSASAYWAVCVMMNSTASSDVLVAMQLWADGVFGNRDQLTTYAVVIFNNKWCRWGRNEFGSCFLMDMSGRTDFLPRWYQSNPRLTPG